MWLSFCQDSPILFCKSIIYSKNQSHTLYLSGSSLPLAARACLQRNGSRIPSLPPLHSLTQHILGYGHKKLQAPHSVVPFHPPGKSRQESISYLVHLTSAQAFCQPRSRGENVLLSSSHHLSM